MSDALFDAVSRIARHEADHRSWVSLGVVTDVHQKAAGSDDHAVSVKLRDSGIVIPNLPVAVGALGFVATPAVNDLVVVVFAEGDPHSGVVVGRLYSTDTAPPEHSDGQHVLQLPPGGGSPAIDLLMDPATPEVKLVVNDTTVTIGASSVNIKTGDTEFVLDGSGGGSVKVNSGNSTVEMGSSGAVSLEAGSKLEIKAPEVLIEGSGKVSISGGIVEVN